MTLYKQDYKLLEAKKVISSLDDSDRDDAIKYYIAHLEKRIYNLEEKNNKYNDFFKQLKSLLPNSNIIYK